MNEANDTNEPHPFKWYVPKNARTLLIGTFPPVKHRWAFEFFYPNPRNIFWKILAEIGGKELPGEGEAAVAARRDLLNALKLGVTDMGGIIRRLSNNSLDENLELIEHMPIFDILDEYPAINRILLTSSSGKVSALAWFKMYLLKHGISAVIPKTAKPIRFSIIYNKKEIEVFILYSPSPRAANRISPAKLTDMYRQVILHQNISH